MKVAICLSGTLRQFRSCYPTFRKHIIEALPHYDFDIFMSSWDSKIPHYKSYHDNRDEGDWKEAVDLFKPKIWDYPIYDNEVRQFLYEESGMDKFQKFVRANRDCKKFHKKDKCPFCGNLIISNEAGMLFQIRNCNRLKIEYEEKNNFKYDYVIRTRYDNFYLSSMMEDYLKIATTNLVIPEGYDSTEQRGSGCNDQIAIGSSEIIDKYSLMYDNMYEFAMQNALSETGYGLPHMAINLQMKKYNINIGRVPLRYVLFKKRGVLKEKLKQGILWKNIKV